MPIRQKSRGDPEPALIRPIGLFPDAARPVDNHGHRPAIRVNRRPGGYFGHPVCGKAGVSRSAFWY
jgi:hypothetical protein